MTTCSKEMLLQTAPTLVMLPMAPRHDGVAQIGVYNFLTKDFAICTPEVLTWLSSFHETKDKSFVAQLCSNMPVKDMENQVSVLTELGFLLDPASDKNNLYLHYKKKWEWDNLVGAFHFSTLNNEFVSLEESVAFQIEKQEVSGEPPISGWPNEGAVFQLPPLHQSAAVDHLQLLASRRTNRISAEHQLTLQEIGDCLFAGFGLTHTVKTPAGERPLSMAPSGGARNPFEAFVIVRRCSDLRPGVYHYIASQHQIAHLSDLPDGFTASPLFGNQPWTDDMSAIVILVALLERSMWKYQDSNAYRVLLIEAGHRAQNIMSTATKLGLSVCPTAALAHTKIQELLQVSDPLLHTPIYALTLDGRRPLEEEIVPSTTVQNLFPTGKQ